ncbi:hypothetical protein A9P82_11735 [Arachidicoccus ginsenosidimutans]|uniref:RagB/SusD family nutrient uptake outer membrane protein n=1 Tax=Arachidicoccus sp. BS20 TaxID=1850526 RepID=UPI0007F16CCC|nr:RagB/SusD family nutrient uptake outer membrane protein [Arachidicoccus sp. BS20]ANI89896.1 hypothetical protein A9P82_11735 [Arachidicoccus sp. BS20]
MKKVKNIFLIIVVVMSCASCKKYLDIVPDDVATIDMAFDNRNDALNYLYTCYSYMQSQETLYANPGFTTSGEIIDNTLGAGDYIFSNPAIWRYLRGIQTADAPVYDNFENLYKAIRKCNTFLENVDKPVDLTQGEKDRWIGEVLFLKAYYYFLLLRQYGPVPIVKENMPINTPTDEAKIPRAPSDSVFSYVVQLLDSAAAVLPPTISAVAEYGRATSIMALALKAKALVTQASPLFNGDPNEAKLKGSDGEQLFPATADPNKWKIAAAACKAAVDAAHQNGIYLYYSNPTSVVPNAIRQQFSIQDPITGPQSLQIPENIWPGNVAVTSGLQAAWMPDLPGTYVSGGADEGTTQLAVPEAIAELFYTNNGVPINEDKNYDYNNRYSITAAPSDNITKYQVHAGYNTIKLHLNREPRFYADLAFDGGVWYGFGVTDTTKLQYQNALTPTYGNNLTGYWPKKLTPYTTSGLSSNLVYSTYYPPVMRLSDLYLLYAEASNEANGPTADAYAYVDSVRVRAGLQGVVESWSQYSNNPNKPLSQSGLRSIIHQERRIELCFEGEIGWDLRRWKEYVPLFAGQSVRGWSGFVHVTTPQQYYQFFVAFVPYMSTKDYFWPINTNTLINDNQLVQNIGW